MGNTMDELKIVVELRLKDFKVKDLTKGFFGFSSMRPAQ
jgi:hypothetical protein